MSIGRLLTIVVVILLVVAGVSWYMGILKVGSDGVRYDSNEAANDTTLDSFSKGSASYQSLQYENAITHYTQALKDKPTDERAANAYYAIARSNQQLKKVPEAIAAYEVFIEKFPNDSRITPAKKELDLLKNMNP